MPTAQHQDRPSILMLEYEKSIGTFLREILESEGYEVSVTHRASDALAIVEHSRGPYIVLMDNFQVNQGAQILAKTVFAWPGLHRRVRIIGIAIEDAEHVLRLDAFLPLPFHGVDVLTTIDRLCAELRTG